MLGADVMRITLVYAEKVKFISFTFQPSNGVPGPPEFGVGRAV
jgi:hypothetical protein